MSGVRAADTSLEAHRAQMKAYRAMGGARRSLLAAQMSDDARGIAAEGIRRRHPGYSEREVQHALNRLLLGDELFRAAWPTAPQLAP